MLLKTLNQSFAQNPPELNQLVKQESEETIIWIRDKNGGLFATTKDREAEINAFHYHVLGGTYQSKIPEVQSMCELSSPDGTSEDLWLAVQRTINGSSVTYIERIGREFGLQEINNASTNIIDKLVYCDSAILFKPGGAFTVVTGLSHLEGQTVVIVADGHYLGEFVVAGSQITLPNAYSEAVVGLNYRSRLKTLNLEDGSGIGSSQGAIKKFDQLTIRFFRTIGAKFGFIQSDLLDIDFKPAGLTPGLPTPLFTGDKLVQFPLNYDREARLIIEQNSPLPCTVTGLIARGMTND